MSSVFQSPSLQFTSNDEYVFGEDEDDDLELFRPADSRSQSSQEKSESFSSSGENHFRPTKTYDDDSHRPSSSMIHKPDRQPLPMYPPPAPPPLHHPHQPPQKSPFIHALDNQSSMHQYRSPQLQSPTFSDASTTVSPRDIFGDDRIMKKTYPSLFAKPQDVHPSTASTSATGPGSSIANVNGSYVPKQHTHFHFSSPLTVDSAPTENGSRTAIFAPTRSDTLESYYLSTSSEDDEPGSPLILPEPNAPQIKEQFHYIPSGHSRKASLTAGVHHSPSKGSPLIEHFAGSSPPGNTPENDGGHELEEPLRGVNLGFQPIGYYTSSDSEYDPASSVMDQSQTLPPRLHSASSPPPSISQDSTIPDDQPEDGYRVEDGDENFRTSDSEFESDEDDDDEEEEYIQGGSTAPATTTAGVAGGKRSSTGSFSGINGEHKRKVGTKGGTGTTKGTKVRKTKKSALGLGGAGKLRRSSSVSGSLSGEITLCTHIDPETKQQCPARFVRFYDLKRHVDTIHSKQGVPSTGFYCEKCQKQFSRKDALIRHQKTIPDCWKGTGRGNRGRRK
ncbi:Zinc finger C2H2-type/integrase DNA-binding domain [Phaffia rhodozyma]|uniref:Zinc finger C2H2-type/integrase DNA-binding domain n=1 Tax=Phaffia rhodozyma TaxID=264483 RepID=A0A0F7SF08_PHARH|nr:Zinc finger C2H2-type/integrase DNA-binding domain [Phaffia rhodozyma]